MGQKVLRRFLGQRAVIRVRVRVRVRILKLTSVTKIYMIDLIISNGPNQVGYVP